MYTLIVTSGPSLDESTHECVHVNSEKYVPVSNDNFVGQVGVRVKDFSGKAPEGSEPITQSKILEESKGMTFSIEASGIYKTEGLTADDLLFGIVFRHSIVDRLPAAYPLGVKALQWFNPTIDIQLEGETPTVLAPLLSIVSRATVTPASAVPHIHTSPTSPAIESRKEDTTVLFNAQKRGTRAAGALESDKDLIRTMLPTSSEYAPPSPVKGWFGTYPAATPSEARQKWFTDREVRKETVIGSECITTDLQNGFLDFKDLSLRIPGFPFTIHLGPYMKGRPVQYCCTSRDRTKVYWVVVFTIVEDTDDTDDSASE